MIKKTLPLIFVLALSNCGGNDDSDCSEEISQIKLDLGEPDEAILYKGSDRPLSILEYIYYCEGISYTFHYGNIVDGCKVEIHTFTPICE